MFEGNRPLFDDLHAEAHWDWSKSYPVIKGQDAHTQFAMLTGVSKFSKVSLFSGLNNLKDITVDARYSAICGYTDEDVDTVFAPELPGLDRAQIRTWYNGYNWTGTSVYTTTRPSRSSKATTPASSTATSLHWGWISGSKT